MIYKIGDRVTVLRSEGSEDWRPEYKKMINNSYTIIDIRGEEDKKYILDNYDTLGGVWYEYEIELTKMGKIRGIVIKE